MDDVVDPRQAGWCETHDDFAWIYDDGSVQCTWCLVVETSSHDCVASPRALAAVEANSPIPQRLLDAFDAALDAFGDEIAYALPEDISRGYDAAHAVLMRIEQEQTETT